MRTNYAASKIHAFRLRTDGRTLLPNRSQREREGLYARQLDAWATGEVDLQAWDESFQAHKTDIAVENGDIIGFGDMDESGYLDRLYVRKDYQGQGIASAICDELERFAAGKTFTTHASITAKLFFQHRGYHVVRKQEVIRHGVALTNFVMEKQPERAK